MEDFLTIRDRTHNYSTLSEREKELIQTKIFQRLRNIKQNALACYTYPCLLGSRFEHSLGVCNLAGQMIKAALNNRTGNADRFISDFRNLLNNQLEAEFDEKETKQKIIQLTRFAGLLHDIGHLPFSHAFEKCIGKTEYATLILAEQGFQDFIEYQPISYHVYVTLKIIKEDPTNEIDSILKEDKDLIISILNPGKSKLFRALKSIIDSDLDADRGDFLLRDGVKIGEEFGRYDLYRMIENITIYYDDDENEYLILPNDAARSVIERYLTERYNLYKWVYFHHHVYFSSTLPYYIIELLLTCLLEKDWNQDLLDFIEKGVKQLDYKNYIFDDLPSDDIWFTSFLRDLYYRLNQIEDFEDYPLSYRIHRMLEYILFRKKISATLWKTDLRFGRFNQDIFFPDFEEQTRCKGMRPRLSDANPGKKVKFLLNFIHEALDPYLVEELQDLVNENLPEEVELIIAPPMPFKPFETGASVRYTSYAIIDTSGDKVEPVTIAEVSPALHRLQLAWERDVHIYAYLIFQDEEKGDSWTELIETAEKIFSKTVADYMTRKDIYSKFYGWLEQNEGLT